MRKVTIKKQYYGDNFIEYVNYNKPYYTGYCRAPKQTTYLDGSPIEKTATEKLIQFKTIEEALEYCEMIQETQRIITMRRTKKKITEIIMANISLKSYFLTFTFDKDITNIYEANRYWTKFMMRLKYNYGVEFAYICIPERQPKSKRIHYHVILFNGFNMKQEDLKKIWGGGFIKIKKIRDITQPKRLANYFMNYMTKDEQNEEITGKKYFTSRKIKRKKSVYVDDYESIEEFFKELDTANDDSKKEWYTLSSHKTLIKLI